MPVLHLPLADCDKENYYVYGLWYDAVTNGRKVDPETKGVKLVHLIEPTSRQFDSDLYDLRRKITSTICWAIPSPAAIDFIVALGKPIIEIGAGSGLWGKLLTLKGADVILVDCDSPVETNFKKVAPVIREDGLSYLSRHDGCIDRALFLCWPQRDMLVDVIDAYTGDTIIWIGDESCCGYIDQSDPRFEEVCSYYEIPSWPYIRDWLKIYKRIAET